MTRTHLDTKQCFPLRETDIIELIAGHSVVFDMRETDNVRAYVFRGDTLLKTKAFCSIFKARLWADRYGSRV